MSLYQIFDSWLCWAILALALVCYQQVWLEFLDARHSNDENSKAVIANNLEFTNILITALPLIGLLGTIIGLLDCFTGIQHEGASSELISGGISDALLTTQLGLICAIPGWLLQAYTRSVSEKAINSPVAFGK